MPRAPRVKESKEQRLGGTKMILASKEIEQDALVQVAKLMCASARTAPKGRGVDEIETALILDGAEKTELVDMMRKMSTEDGAAFFDRDAGNVEKAGAVVLIGSRGHYMGLPQCGFCGFQNCAACKKAGGRCVFPGINLGIAVGSAAGVASLHHMDNRIMFSIGSAAIKLGLFSSGEVVEALGIPLFVGGKSPFFDRG